jgi:hypothetical protein
MRWARTMVIGVAIGSRCVVVAEIVIVLRSVIWDN